MEYIGTGQLTEGDMEPEWLYLLRGKLRISVRSDNVWLPHLLADGARLVSAAEYEAASEVKE